MLMNCSLSAAFCSVVVDQMEVCEPSG